MTPEKVTIGDAELWLGDCREVPMLGKVDAMITDPPYGQDYKPKPLSLTLSRTINSKNWINSGKFVPSSPMFGDDGKPDIEMLLSLGETSIVFGAHKFHELLPPSGTWLVWDKKVALPTNSWGDGELAWTNISGPLRIYRHMWSGLIIEKGAPEMERELSGGAQRRVHPTQKPVRLMEWCLGFVPDAKQVLDPYMGSGTTGVACANLGRRFIGIEIEERYFDIACKRIERAQAQGRLFQNEPVCKPVQEGLSL